MENVENRPVVLVTGVDGLIGEPLVESLRSRYAVAGLDNDPPDVGPECDFYAQCDLTDDQSVREGLAKIRREAGPKLVSCVHLAAYYDFSGEPSPMYRKLTVDGTRRLLRGLQEFDCEQFLFSSTLLVHEPVEEGEELTEGSPVRPAWAYPKSKLTTERLIERERGQIPAVIARIAGVYDEKGRAVPIAQQIARIYEKQLESYLFPGDPDHGQAFVHLNDTVTFIEACIEKRHELDPYEIFLVGESDLMSYEELQDQIGELIHGDEWPTIRIPKTVAKIGAWFQNKLGGEDGEFIKPWMIDLADQHYPIAIDKARSKLGWEPQERLRDTLAKITGNLLRDPVGWYKINGLEPPEDVQPRGAGAVESRNK